MKNPPKYCATASEPVFKTSNRSPNEKYIVPAFFGDRFVGKENGLRKYNPSGEELGVCRHFCIAVNGFAL
jgi:hypothetical protein